MNFVYIFRLIPGLRKDYSPISFAFAGTAIAIGILRYRLFDLKPIAYRSLIENMSDGILVLDDQNRIVDFNPAFESIIDVPINQALGQPALFVLKPWRDIVERFQNETNIHTEISIDLQGSIRHYDLRISPLYYREIIYGRLILLRDITARKQAEEQLLKFATTDSLTGLLNRRHFFSLAEKEFERSRRYNHDLSVIMFDIDHFKRVNDEYGHAVGDVVLQAIADTFKQSNREIDLIARWGGEEFVILLPETDLLPAQKTAERLRSIIESTPIGTDVVVITITISAGVTSMSDEEDLSVETLLNRADIALYQSKDRGRNRVTVWRRSQEES